VPPEPRWVPLDAVVALNREIVATSDEPHEVRDPKALQSAIAHPWNVWIYFLDGDIAVLAARLYTGLASARGFAAGNKRTAFRAAVTFIEQNGYRFDMPEQPHALDRLLGFFDGRLGQQGVVEWFRFWMAPLAESEKI
jgi:death-on-curing protein